MGYRATSVYDALMRVSAELDALGRRRTSIYDPISQLIAKIDALGYRRTSAYDGVGNAVSEMSARGYVTTSAYDALDRLVSRMDALGYRTTSLYDPVSRLVGSVDALGFVTTSVYNGLGQRVAVQDAFGSRFTSVYDRRGQLSASVNALGWVTSYSYDALGRRLGWMNALGTRMTSVYDASGNAVAQVNGLGFVTTTLYDALERGSGESDALGRRQTLVYDGVGRRLASTDAKGQITTSVYNGRGEEVGRLYGDATRLTFGYDPVGNLLTVADLTGLRTFAYDPRHSLLTELTPELVGAGFTSTYDADGNRLTLDTRWGRFTYAYDPRGQMSAMTDPGMPALLTLSGASLYRYDARGGLNQVDHPGGGRSTLTYDALGRAAQVRHTVGRGAESEHAYVLFDALSRPLVKDTLAARYTSTYDAADQLVSEGRGVNRVTWTYDAAFRRTLEQRGSALTTYAYDGADQLTSTLTGSLQTTLSYDAHGNQRSRLRFGSPTTLLYDGANRLSGVTLWEGTRFSYRSRYDGLLVGMTEGSAIQTLVWESGDLLAEIGSDPFGGQGGQESETWLYVQGQGAQIGRRVGYDVTDGGGANVAQPRFLDGQGNVQVSPGGKVSYEAWGKVVSGSSGLETRYFGGGLGYWYDGTLDLYYVRARWYEAGTGRWLSPDPVAGELPYTYVDNMPTVKVDPSGLQGRPHPAVHSHRSQQEVQQYRSLLEQQKRRRFLQRQRQIREARAEKAYQERSRTEYLKGNLFEVIAGGAARIATTGSPFPTEEEFSEASATAVAGLEARTSQLRSVVDQARADVETFVRQGLKTAHPIFDRFFVFDSRASAQWAAARKKLPKHLAFLYPPPPGTADYLDYRVGFGFGIIDSLVSLLLMPLDVVLSLLDLIRLLSESSSIWDDLQEIVRNRFSAFFGELAKAGSKDAFTQGKITGRLLVEAVFFVLGAAAGAKAGLKLTKRLRSGSGGAASGGSVGVAAAATEAEAAVNRAGLSVESADAKIKPAMKANIVVPNRLGVLDESPRRLFPDERPLVEYLIRQGEDVTTLVENNNPRSGTGRDVRVGPNKEPAELKNLRGQVRLGSITGSVYSITEKTILGRINQSLRRGGQAPYIILDIRETSITRLQAEGAAKSAFRLNEHNRREPAHLKKLRFVGDDFDLTLTNPDL